MLLHWVRLSGMSTAAVEPTYLKYPPLPVSFHVSAEAMTARRLDNTDVPGKNAVLPSLIIYLFSPARFACITLEATQSPGMADAVRAEHITIMLIMADVTTT